MNVGVEMSRHNIEDNWEWSRKQDEKLWLIKKSFFLCQLNNELDEHRNWVVAVMGNVCRKRQSLIVQVELTRATFSIDIDRDALNSIDFTQISWLIYVAKVIVKL